ncbi:protein kinase [bacterium]|nr:protein kinase [bacterium]
MTHSEPDDSAAACPDAERLIDFAFGRLPQHVITAVHQHVAQCSDCAERLAALDPASDEFCALVRDAPRDAAADRDAELAETVRNLCVDVRTLVVKPESGGHAAATRTAPAATRTAPAAARTASSLAEAVQLIAAVEDMHPAKAPPAGSTSTADESHWELGEFELCRVLGIGGMSIVFEAIEHPIERRVALKMVQPHVALRPGFSDRFLREARSLAAIENDHVVTIFRYGQFQTLNYLTMPILPGRSLASWLDECDRMNPGEVIRLGLHIAAGLSAIHDAGLIHRDLSPANVWLRSNSDGLDAALTSESLAGEPPAGESPAGEPPAGESPAGEFPAGEFPAAPQNRESGANPGPACPSRYSDGGSVEASQTRDEPAAFHWQRAELIDFGLARQIDDGLTGSRVVMGTPGHVAPEVSRGLPATIQSDLFALGALLHRALTGTLPAMERSLLDTLTAAGDELTDLRHGLDAPAPTPLENLILDLLQPLPENRPASVADVARRLLELSQPGTASHENLPLEPGRAEIARSSGTNDARARLSPAPAVPPAPGSATPRAGSLLIMFLTLAAGGTLAAVALVPAGWWSRAASQSPGSRHSASSTSRDERVSLNRVKPFGEAAENGEAAKEYATVPRSEGSEHSTPSPPPTTGRIAFEEMFDQTNRVLTQKDQKHAWGIANGVYYDEIHANQAGLAYFSFVGPNLVDFRYECLCRVQDGVLSASFRILGDELRQSHLECLLRPDGTWWIRRLDRRRPDRKNNWHDTIETRVAGGEFPTEWFPAAPRWAVFSIHARGSELEIQLDRRTVARATDVRFTSTPTADPDAALPESDQSGTAVGAESQEAATTDDGTTDGKVPPSTEPASGTAEDDDDHSKIPLNQINWRQLGNSTRHTVRVGHWPVSDKPARFEMDWQRLWQLTPPDPPPAGNSDAAHAAQ